MTQATVNRYRTKCVPDHLPKQSAISDGADVVEVEFVGQGPQYTYLVDEDGDPILDHVGKPVLEVDYEHENGRDIRVDGVTARVLYTQAHANHLGDPSQGVEGLQRSYQWGPNIGTFVQPMLRADWEVLKTSPVAERFKAVSGE